MSEKMRVTTHNGRTGKDGAYSVKHNDRNFDTKHSAHIDSSLTAQNHEWKFDTETIGESNSFEEHEQKFYEYYFSSALEQRNDRARQSRHMERVQTMEQYRKNKRACPEETILQIGCAGNTVAANVLKAVCKEYMQWHMETYPNVKLLDAALHVDEPNAAPHLHLRRVWTVADSEGNLSVSQSKALEQLGIERPNPQKKRDRYNNPKVVFTQQCRDKFIEICEKYGIVVEHTPLEPSKSGLSHDEYIRQQEQAKAEQARAELAKLQEETKPFRELEITTQAVTDNVKVKTGLFSGKTTVTLPQEDFDILLQQAKAYVLNRNDIDNLREEQEKLQQEKERLQQMEQDLIIQQKEMLSQIKMKEQAMLSHMDIKERAIESKATKADIRLQQAEQRYKEADEFYKKQQNINQILEQTEKELTKTKMKLTHTLLQRDKSLEDTQKEMSVLSKKYNELQKLQEELQEQLAQIQQIHQEELKNMEQSIQATMEQQINEKENKIQDLQSRINRANSMANRYIHVMKIMCQFTNMHSDLTEEQKAFLKAIQEYSLERFSVKKVETIRNDIERFGQSKKIPEDFQNLLNSISKEMEQKRQAELEQQKKEQDELELQEIEPEQSYSYNNRRRR